MNITKNQVDELNSVIKIQLGKEDYAERVEKAMKNQQRKVAVDGFRKGKTPMGIVKKMYGKAILIEEINQVLGETLSNYIKDNDLQILGEPLPNETEQKELDLDGEDFEFCYDIALSPEVNAKLSKRDKVPYYTVLVDDTMMDKQMESLCKSNGNLVLVDVVEGTEYLKGELIELDADGKAKEDGIKIEDASMSVFHIKDEATVKKFVGAKVGKEIKFNPATAFPNKTDLAAMLHVTKEEVEHITSDFCIIISEIKRFVDAEVNQELFDKVYGEGNVKSVEEFRAKVKEGMGDQLKGHSEYRFTVDAKERLLKKNEDVKLPEAFLKRWIIAVNKGLSAEDVEKDFDGYREEFKWQLIKTALIKEFGIKVETEDIKGMAREVAAAQLQQYGLFGLSDEQLDGFAVKLLENEKQREQLYERALDGKVYAAVRENVKVEDQDISMENFEKLFQK